MKIMVINGPDMFIRPGSEKGGPGALEAANERLAKRAEELGISCEFFQADGEGELVSLIQSAWNAADGIILNAGDYAHYSIAIRDAIASVKQTPVIEVHPANIYAQEEFRRVSMLSAVCRGVISGFGYDGYFLALYAMAEMAAAGSDTALQQK